MAEYIFYTMEGFTQAPDGTDVDNCQIMGFTHGDNLHEGLRNLLEENEWIINRGFNPECLIGRSLAIDEVADSRSCIGDV